jgi:hypothetical protein
MLPKCGRGLCGRKADEIAQVSDLAIRQNRRTEAGRCSSKAAPASRTAARRPAPVYPIAGVAGGRASAQRRPDRTIKMRHCRGPETTEPTRAENPTGRSDH